LELAGFGVRVNAIAPGDILTPLTEKQLQAAADREQALADMASVYPLRRIGTPEEAAAAIKFLASPAAAFITGTILNVDGGLCA
jgi:NAD(P)-dependent dehydrogenase (short-subunit alcohol dehydrogenase family)